MAGTDKKKRTRTSVPVASRVSERKNPPKASSKLKKPRSRMDIAGYAVLAAVSIIVMLAVATPLNNYYAGRAEIARLNESIAAKQAEKERLLGEIGKYQSESYIQQEARRRLGVVAPGETAYRILDPQMTADDSLTTDGDAQREAQPWYGVLWDSVAEPTQPLTATAADATEGAAPSDAADAANASGEPAPSAPAEAPAPAPAP